MKQISNLRFEEVIWQRPYELENVWELLSHLASTTPRGFLIWEARAENGKIRYLLGSDARFKGKLHEIFRTHGDIDFYECHDGDRPIMNHVRSIRVSKPLLSLNTDVSEAVIRAGLVSLAATKPEDTAVMQIILGPSFAPSRIPRDFAEPTDNWLQIALGTVEKASPESRKSAKEKAEQHSYDALIRVGVSGGTNRLDNIISAMKTLESAGAHIHTDKDSPSNLHECHIPWKMPLRLSVKEVTPFMLLPVGEEALPGSLGIHPKVVMPPRWYQPPKYKDQARSYAYSMNHLDPKLLSISPRDSLEHTILLGPTGSGKSTAMEHLILSDIEAGRSVLVLDPKADLVTDILERLPEDRVDDVVVIDPSDPSPVGFNPLIFKGFQSPALIADSILAVFKEIFEDSWGVRTQDVLSAALLTLVETEGATLLWLPELLTNPEFRKKITSNVKDRIALKPFWDAFEKMKDSERRTTIDPVLNKLRQITFRPGLRNVLGQAKPKFNLTDLFYERKIVLIPLNKGLIGGESARLLGSLIVGLTWTLALKRAEIPPEKRHIVSLYIDELQDYISLPTDLSDALAQARGLGVGITMAHQYRAQLPPELMAGVDANARNKIIFGLNSTDAKALATQAPELTQLDFMSLPRYQIYTTVMNGGKSTGWMMGTTLPPRKAVRMAAELKAKSMARYGIPASVTEEEFLKIIEPEEVPEPDEEIVDAPIGRKKKVKNDEEQ